LPEQQEVRWTTRQSTSALLRFILSYKIQQQQLVAF